MYCNWMSYVNTNQYRWAAEYDVKDVSENNETRGTVERWFN